MIAGTPDRIADFFASKLTPGEVKMRLTEAAAPAATKTTADAGEPVDLRRPPDWRARGAGGRAAPPHGAGLSQAPALIGGVIDGDQLP